MTAPQAHYTDPADRKYTADLRRGAPEAFKAFIQFNSAVFEAETEVPRKYKELMALAVALTTQCVYCIEAHTDSARTNGATEAEIAETAMLAAAMRAGAAFSYGRMAMKFAVNHQHS